MGTCKNCAWWSENEPEVGVRPNGYCVKSANESWRRKDEPLCWSPELIFTGPDFGCVKWELSPSAEPPKKVE